MAVYVTVVPGQMVLTLPTMLTAAVRFGFTVIVTVLDVAGVPVAQVAFEFMMQVTASLLLSVVVVNVAEFVPAFTAFTCH